jgi:hypothetical protein
MQTHLKIHYQTTVNELVEKNLGCFDIPRNGKVIFFRDRISN